uniref:Uncharacterized protein n=1 Tax=Picea glauca TaxID=3330 RepID=A0A101M4T5_PICGL|nr:hypothetical protein ABT39_MTgene679 [Picea glauca]
MYPSIYLFGGGLVESSLTHPLFFIYLPSVIEYIIKFILMCRSSLSNFAT